MRLYLTVFTALFAYSLAISQEASEISNSFGFNANAKLGTSILNTSDLNDFSGNVNAAEVLASYKIKNKIKISTGLAMLRFNSNYFTNNEQFSFASDFLQIPIKINFGYGLLKNRNIDNLDFILGVGFLGTYHLSEARESKTNKFNNDYQGWHFGMMSEIGLEFNLNQDIDLGLFFESNFANESFAQNDEIRLQNNLIKLTFNYNF